MGNSTHRWKFMRVGGVDQVVIRSGADIAHLDQLDQKLWVALACPTRLLEFDSRTLDLLDFDKDGRIRAPEIIDISRWVREVFKNPDDLIKGGDTVALSAIGTENPVGARLRSTAERVLRDLGKENADSFSLADVTATIKAFAARKLNGDGVVPPESARDPNSQQAILDILATHGGVTDRSGKLGVNQSKVDAFFADASALLAWNDRAESRILPLGPDTPAAAAALNKIRAKVDDYFTRCRLADFDPRAAALLNQAEAEFKALSTRELNLATPEIAHLPLAQAEAGRPLPLERGLNPAWRSAIADFRSNTIEKILGLRPELTQQDWAELQQNLEPYATWQASKPASTAEKLGLERLRALLNSPVRAELTQLIADDLAQEIGHDELVSLEKLVRMQRDLCRLLNNFVSFSEFYHRHGAIFQVGTLYLDARSCDLCVHVADPAKHAALAGLARTYLAYCDCTRAGEKMSIAAAFTAGDSDHLMVGRNGVFYDRKGRDWDATITKIVDNPISLGQAFFAPYKKFVRLIEEQVAKRAAAADAVAQEKLGTTATHVVNLDPPKPGAKPADKRVDVGTVAALGVALGSIGTFLGVIFAKFVDLGWWIPLALLGLILAISGPSVIISWLKLRQRNLGPILDANGWAVNGRMKVNVPFGRALSKRAKIPPGSEMQLVDPFVENHDTRNSVIAALILALIVAALWWLDLLNSALPERLQHRTVPPPPRPAAQLAGPVRSL